MGLLKKESSKDKHMLNLISLINSSFPEEKNEMPLDLLPYWSLGDNLWSCFDGRSTVDSSTSSLRLV